MACTAAVWHALMGACAMSMLLAALHTGNVQTAVWEAISFARDHVAPSGQSSPPLVGSSAKDVEATAAYELRAAFAKEGGGNWAQWFKTTKTADDAFDEDAVKLLLKEAEVLEDQWRFAPAETKLHEAFKRVSSWVSDVQHNKKPGPQRDRASRQAIEVLLRLGKFLEEHGRAAEAIPTFRLAKELSSTRALLSPAADATNGDGFFGEVEEERLVEALAAQVNSEVGLARTLCLVGGRQGGAVREARVLFVMALGHKQRLAARLEAQVHADFAECLHQEGALSEARAGLAAAHRLVEEAAQHKGWPLPEREALQSRLARLQGGISHDDGSFADAVRFYGEYLQTGPKMDEGVPALANVLPRFEVMQDLSLALASLGRVDEAFATMDDVDHLQKASVDELRLKSHKDTSTTGKFLTPSVALDGRLQSSIARSRVVRAELALEQSRVGRQQPPKEARQYALEAVALLKEVSAPAEDLENALNTLGNVQMSFGEAKHAQDAYSEAVKLAVDDHGNKSPLVAALYHNLASALEEMGKLKEAMKLYTSALDIQLSTLGEQNPDTAGSLDSVARCLAKSGLHSEALEAAKRAAKAARAAYPEGHWLRRETEARVKRLQQLAALPSSKEFLVSAHQVRHLVG